MSSSHFHLTRAQNPPCCLRRVKSSDNPRGMAIYSSWSSSAATAAFPGENNLVVDDDGGDTTAAALEENHEVDFAATVRVDIDGEDVAPEAEEGRPEPAMADRDEEAPPVPPSPAPAPLCSTVYPKRYEPTGRPPMVLPPPPVAAPDW